MSADIPEPCTFCGWQYDDETLAAARRGEIRLDPTPTHRCARYADYVHPLGVGVEGTWPTRPRLLETHGCQGIGHAGYIRSGWDIDAVDINNNHAKYHPGQLIIADAETYIREHGHKYHARHTSPPCQWYTRGNAPRRGTASKWERTIPPIREALEAAGGPYVIENVKDAVWDLRDPIMLCGCMFDLSTIDYTCTSPGEHDGTCDTVHGVRVHLERPRLFEVNFPIPGLIEQTIEVRKVKYTVRSPRRCDHSTHEWTAGAYGGARRDKYEARYIRKGGYVPPEKSVVMALLGITPEDRAGAEKPEPTWNGLFESIPPAYTEWIGGHLLHHIRFMGAATKVLNQMLGFPGVDPMDADTNGLGEDVA